jgi:hypothetical protein
MEIVTLLEHIKKPKDTMTEEMIKYPRNIRKMCIKELNLQNLCLIYLF